MVLQGSWRKVFRDRSSPSEGFERLPRPFGAFPKAWSPLIDLSRLFGRGHLGRGRGLEGPSKIVAVGFQGPSKVFGGPSRDPRSSCICSGRAKRSCMIADITHQARR